jgi:hypothetical protein
MISNGFPADEHCYRFLDGLTNVLTCETPYNRELYAEAARRTSERSTSATSSSRMH